MEQGTHNDLQANEPNSSHRHRYKKHRQHRTKKISKKKVRLQRVLNVTGIICAVLITLYFILHFTNIDDGSDYTDIKYILLFPSIIVYIAYVASCVSSFFLKNKYGKSFRLYQIAGLLFTLLFLLLILISDLDKPAAPPPQYDPDLVE